MNKVILFQRSFVAVALQLGVDKETMKAALTTINRVFCADDYKGLNTLVPMLADKATTLRFVPTWEYFKKLDRNSKASETLNTEGGTCAGEDVGGASVCVYSVRDEEKLRVAIYDPNIKLNFAINVTTDAVYVRRCLNSPKVQEDFKWELEPEVEGSWVIYGYHTENSSIDRYLVQYSDHNLELPVGEEEFKNIYKASVQYAKKTQLFGGND